jgi:hypothetical protein
MVAVPENLSALLCASSLDLKAFHGFLSSMHKTFSIITPVNAVSVVVVVPVDTVFGTVVTDMIGRHVSLELNLMCFFEVTIASCQWTMSLASFLVLLKCFNLF